MADAQAAYAHGSEDTPPVPKVRRRGLRVPALLFVLFATLLSVKLMVLPINRLLESRYCLEYYRTHDPAKIPSNGEIPESACKVDIVQQKLGRMMGALDTTIQACDLAVAMPMGYFADKIGRRLVLSLNCTSTAVLLLWIAFLGAVQSIPPSAILAGPLLSLFGGGNNVFKSVSVALLSDLAETDSQRTSNISYFLSTDYLTMLAGPMFAAILMPHGLTLPLWTGVALICIGLPLLSFVPSSNVGPNIPPSSARRHGQHADQEQRPLLRASEDLISDARSKPQTRIPIRDFFEEYVNVIKASSNFQLVLLAKFLASFASSSSNILALYITLRTGWTFGEVGYLYTLKGMINILLAAVIVPASAKYFTDKDASKTDSSFSFNLAATKLALFVSVVGAIAVAFASDRPTIVAPLCIYALGSVLPVFMYAIARSPEIGVLDENNEGSGFTVLVVVQALGALIGAPTMAAVWVQAIKLGGHGLGMPYLVSAAAYSMALAVALFIKSGEEVDARRLD